MFKVCCSDFSTPIPLATPGLLTYEGDAIENHPNVRLLSDECGVNGEDRIIGGSIAGLYEFPWIVLLGKIMKRKAYFDCGGTLITSRYVLTAAHCISKESNYFVRVGEYNISSEVDCTGSNYVETYQQCAPKCQDIDVSLAITHPGYKHFPYISNDIALLRLKNPVDLSVENAATICLPVFKDLRDSDISNEIGTVVGWGATDSGTRSNILHKVDVPINSEETCKLGYEGTRYGWSQRFRNTFCAGEEGKDSCKVDSGGPLVIIQKYNESYRYVQYGIVSYGITCGADTPSIYTDVRKFMKWILDTIKP